MKMTIVRKVYLGIGVLAAALIGLAFFFQMNIKDTKDELDKIDKYREIQAQIAPRIMDHMKWGESLAVGTILLGKEFKGQLDPTKCKFGEWYYSFKPPKEVEETFRSIEEPHKRLHATAPKIIAALKNNNINLAKKIYQEETMPALEETQKKLTDLRGEFKDKIVGVMTADLRTHQDKMGKTAAFAYAGVILSLMAGSVIFLARPLKRNLAGISGWINAMSAGDFSKNVDIKTNDEIKDMASDLNVMAEKIKSVMGDIKMLSNAAVEGRLDVRADALKHQGDFIRIVEGINHTVDSLVGLIDSMPLPAMIIDKEFTIRYMNQTGAKILNTSQKQLIGDKCYNHFKTSDCHTDNCACAQAMKRVTEATRETDAHPMGYDLDIQYTGRPMKDQGGNVIGAFEVVVDQTAVKKAARVANKIAAYQETETEKLKGALAKMAGGYLDLNLSVSSCDEDTKQACRSFEMIVGSLNQCAATFKQLIAQTNEASKQVSVAADQIAGANQNFSQRITEQAASVEETSSTMEEMSASIRQTAENAKEASKLIQTTKTMADSGITAMSETINAMDEINKSSGKIANISNVIEEVAFQTNLLALNAAVEAARAGEHGKGFAVVASEIRNLAQRTAQSAKEITGLIEDSVEKTGKGVKLAQELNVKLGEIGTSIKKVVDLMNEVAAASEEQSSGTSQVNTAMTQIDQTTQQNASLVEETASAAEELAAEAKELLNIISFFKIEEDTAVQGLPVRSRPSVARENITARKALRPVAEHKKEISKHVHAESAFVTAGSGKGEKNDGGFEEF